MDESLCGKQVTCGQFSVCRQSVASMFVHALPLLQFDNLAEIANCNAVVLQNDVQWIQAGHIGFSLSDVLKMIRFTI